MSAAKETLPSSSSSTCAKKQEATTQQFSSGQGALTAPGVPLVAFPRVVAVPYQQEQRNAVGLPRFTITHTADSKAPTFTTSVSPAHAPSSLCGSNGFDQSQPNFSKDVHRPVRTNSLDFDVQLTEPGPLDADMFVMHRKSLHASDHDIASRRSSIASTSSEPWKYGSCPSTPVSAIRRVSSEAEKKAAFRRRSTESMPTMARQESDMAYATPKTGRRKAYNRQTGIRRQRLPSLMLSADEMATIKAEPSFANRRKSCVIPLATSLPMAYSCASVKSPVSLEPTSSPAEDTNTFVSLKKKMQGVNWILEGSDKQINPTFDRWMLRAFVAFFVLTSIGILFSPQPNTRLAGSITSN